MRTIAERAERQVYALLRFTSAARDAGFIELAQNIWQGLLEYNFDIEPGGTEARRLQRVEELWAKEAPKIGDPVERRVPESQTMSPCILQQSSSSIAMHGQASSLWANQEIRLSRQQVDGGGGAENVEDPFSIILFQDIEPFLFTITSDKALLLIDGLLTFYGLPLLANDAPSPASHWQADPFVLHLLRGTSIATEVFGERTTSKTTPTTLFSRQHHCWKTDHATFIRQVLDTLLRRLQACPELTALAEYYMALMAHSFPNEARQAAKNILKRVPLNLRLYHAMGLVEALLGNNEAADKISASALDMCGRLPEAQRDDEALLRLSWVWQAIDRQDGPDALSRLREASQGAPAFEKLIQSRDQALQHGRYYQACAYSEMLALEPYLVHDFDLRNALAAFQDEMEHLASSAGSSAFGLELLHQARALLVQHHVRQFKHFSPIQIRDALRQSVLQFPANTLFLRLFMENEARFIIDDRIRSSTRDVVLSQEEPSLVTYLAYIQHEIRSIESFGVTQHSIRTRLEQALSSRCGKCSQGLWMEYFFFELLVAKDLRRAKAVFYRGFESVPWSKQFALLAFEHLAVVFEEDELREVHGLMQHRGLRLWSEYMEAK